MKRVVGSSAASTISPRAVLNKKRRANNKPAGPVAVAYHDRSIDRSRLEDSSSWNVTTGGLSYRSHYVRCPLNHFSDSSRTIRIFVREVVDSSLVASDGSANISSLEALLYLQGGPGFECAREGIGTTPWIISAVKDHKFRVFLMDQRGTGYSSPLTVESITMAGTSDEQLKLLTCFRADSIVEDAEVCRKLLLEENSKDKSSSKKWTLLGQSYGGFCSYSYLSLRPEGLKAVLTTGGVPPITQGCSAKRVYEHTYKRVNAQTLKYYQRYPQDKTLVSEITAYVSKNRVQMPSGSILTPRYIQAMGIALGQAGGFERLHFLFERAWETFDVLGNENEHSTEKKLSYAFIKRCDDFFAFDTNPLYLIMHESIYCNGSSTEANSDVPLESRWSAEQVLVENTVKSNESYKIKAKRLLSKSQFITFSNSGEYTKEFFSEHTNFTGEMVFPFMLETNVRLQPLYKVAHLLHEKKDWSKLYCKKTLKENKVPVASLSYYDDMFVDVHLSQETVDATANVRHWVTSEYMHSGLRENGPAILQRLLSLVRNELPLF